MDNQNDYIVSSREEYIRIARESCLKNLGNNPGDLDTSKKNKVNFVGSPFPYEKNDYERDSFLMFNGNLNQKWVKNLLIRTICALVLFLTIFLIDKFKFTYKDLNSQSIETIVTSNKGFDAAEDYFVKLFKNIIIKDEEVVNE